MAWRTSKKWLKFFVIRYPDRLYTVVCYVTQSLHVVSCIVMLQPFDVTKTENAVHKLMIQYLFMPSVDMKYEDAVSSNK